MFLGDLEFQVTRIERKEQNNSKTPSRLSFFYIPPEKGYKESFTVYFCIYKALIVYSKQTG